MSTKWGPKIETFSYELGASGFVSGIIVNWRNGDGSIGEQELFSTPKFAAPSYSITCARYGSFTWRTKGSNTDKKLLLASGEDLPVQYSPSTILLSPGGVSLTVVSPC